MPAQAVCVGPALMPAPLPLPLVWILLLAPAPPRPLPVVVCVLGTVTLVTGTVVGVLALLHRRAMEAAPAPCRWARRHRWHPL
jgi:hypothetical protein